MRSRFIAFAACALLGIGSRAIGQPAAPETGRDTDTAAPGWTFVVIRLKYADAEHVASVLRELLPPGVRVVPYQPTNSVLIAGDRAVMEDIAELDVATEPTSN